MTNFMLYNRGFLIGKTVAGVMMGLNEKYDHPTIMGKVRECSGFTVAEGRACILVEIDRDGTFEWASLDADTFKIQDIQIGFDQLPEPIQKYVGNQFVSAICSDDFYKVTVRGLVTEKNVVIVWKYENGHWQGKP